MPDILRNRFRLLPALDRGRRGLLLDGTRLPDSAETAVRAGSYWDGDVSAASDAFDLPVVSGRIACSWRRPAFRAGQAWLEAGIGGGGDLRLSGLTDGFAPVVDAGRWFDLDRPERLWSDDAVEAVYSSGVLFLNPPPADGVPVELAGYHVDPWGRARAFDRFVQRQSFAPLVPGTETLSAEPGTDPVLRPRVRAGILWQNVDPSRREFLVDEATGELIVNGTWTSGVRAEVRRAPWSRDSFQLPLVPVAAVEGTPFLEVREDVVAVSGGVGRTALSVGISAAFVTRGSGVRLSGTLSASGTLVAVSGSLAGWPASGLLLVDDGDWGREVAAYAALSGQFLSGVVRTSGAVHRDGAPVRWVVSGASVDASGRLSGVADGLCAVDYLASGFGWSLDPRRGLMAVSGASGLHRAVLHVDYARGLGLTYEPSGASPEATLDPVDFLAGGASHGILWTSRYPLRPRAVRLATSQGAGASGIVGPVYAGNDYLAVEATVVDRDGTPIPNVPVRLVLDQPDHVGLVDGLEPSDAAAKTTDAFGVARFVYTPPDTIGDLGYFFPASAVVSGSGLVFGDPVAFEELCSGSVWKTTLYAVWRDDGVLDYVEESGVFDWRADGRFEVVARVAATIQGLQDREPVQPAAALDENGKTARPGGLVKTLWYPSGSLPAASGIGAFFVGAERRLRLGAVVPDGTAVSPSLELAVGIPPFMAGEFLWGPATDPDVKALDSLSYLTVDPLRAVPGARSAPNLVGNVFHVRRAKTDEFLRQRFYLRLDAVALAGSEAGRQTLREAFALRNRVILERK